MRSCQWPLELTPADTIHSIGEITLYDWEEEDGTGAPYARFTAFAGHAHHGEIYECSSSRALPHKPNETPLLRFGMRKWPIERQGYRQAA